MGCCSCSIRIATQSLLLIPIANTSALWLTEYSISFQETVSAPIILNNYKQDKQ